MSDKNDVVIINLDRPRELWFGHKALKMLRSMQGKGLDELDLDSFKPEDLEIIMYCGLQRDAKEHNETLKLEDMEDLLDKAPYSVIIEGLQLAFKNSFGNFGDDEKNLQRVAVEAQKKKWNWEESLKLAIRIGINIKDYEDMTPYQLGLHVDVYREKFKANQEEKIVLEYMNAVWQRSKRMPSLTKVLGQEKKRMTPEEMLEQVKKLNASMGGEVIGGS